ncbi:flavin reductase family protein [Albimonas pacifica]|uniref:NADH-FMN oxidoreductase RutF, flavin reductase (DIM6/NTAB) family n=1 Tax=Albimonas pacifica TaxID=1114924 RepID=A0A1I3FDB8_9RHOB|nr:flavin reductase family protein [Albimonas pacifica]SFI09154.1 NADH-FMN oxidoreductase RutF, flavin reductase (DIM6/NTAB) family [Albimonas pacifica]
MTEAAAAVDPRAFRSALGRFATGVCVVTARVDGEALGMTMSSFNSLSLTPPLVLFSIDDRALSLPLWERATGYAIHVLAESQQDLSNRFARPGGDKWKGLPSETGVTGAPLLSGAAAVFECRPHAIHPGGDHRLFLAEVVRHAHDPDRKPLLFAGGRYGALHPGEVGPADWPLPIHY